MADIGMTIDEVRGCSTFKFKDPRFMGDGSRMGVERRVFEYRIGNSAMRFPRPRYYWLETGKGCDPHIVVLNVGITPQKVSKRGIETFQRGLQAQLPADGWAPGHYVAKLEETIRLWGGSRTAGDGRYWTRGDILPIFETSRIDEEKRSEPAGSGEFILNISQRPKSHDHELVFERP